MSQRKLQWLAIAALAATTVGHARAAEQPSAPRLYNQANAYERDGKLGQAIVSYERARLLAPRDPDIATNLALARASAGVAEPARPWPERLLGPLSTTEWTWLGAGALWLACSALVALHLLRWRRRGLFVAIGMVAAALALVSAGAVVDLGRDSDDAIVVAAHGTPIRLSPFDTAAVQATAREGARLRVSGRHGGFLLVGDGQGHSGWVESAAVQAIVAQPS